MLGSAVWCKRRARHRVARLPAARELQVLPLTEPITASQVVLIACMHFNPCSVTKAADVTRRLREQGELGAVVLETCLSRWQKVEELHPQGSALRMLLDNEMQAAAEEAAEAGLPVVLGDQDVSDLSKSVVEVGQTAIKDLLSPFDGGWNRTASEIGDGLVRLFNVGKRAEILKSDDAISVKDFLDLELILGVPLAVFRYLCSSALKAPIFTTIMASTLIIAAVVPDSPLTDLALVAYQVVLMRIILGAVLRDRDGILAQSVSRVCKEVGGPGKSVVVVLGAAHCNGVKQQLLEGRNTAAANTSYL